MNNILDIKYEKYTLDNGLDVILYEDKSLPIVSVNLWYKVGSANERKGKTGFAHLFEHMMFQGSANVAKELHFKYIQEAGGSLNASTSIDRTNYYETVPSNYLELALWLESDRMGYLLPALTVEKLENQKDVVKNERRQRYENQPYGLAWEKLFAALYPENHPYHWPTIGWMRDIENFELNDIKEFFETFYSPNNASLVIGGKFNNRETKDLIKKYFDSIKSYPEIPIPQNPGISLEDVVKIKYEDDVQLPRLYLTWPSDKLYGKDDAALDILSNLLSGSKNSRFYKSLVFDNQIAQDVMSYQYSGNLAGSFLTVATPKPGVSLQTIKDHLFNELKLIIEKGVTEQELLRAKNVYKSSYIYSLQNLNNMVDQINSYNCYLSEPNSFIFDVNRYINLSKEDIIEVAAKYLDKPFVELEVHPKNKDNQK